MRRLVLFGEEWKRQVREARNLLEDLGLQYRFFDTTSNINNRIILYGLVEDYNTPILFDNGVRLDGITKIRQHLA